MTDYVFGDGEDGEDAQRLLEQAIGCRLPDDAAQSCRTVGDMHGLVVSMLPAPSPNANGCLTSMTFYRLREAFKHTAPAVDWRPATPLRDAGLTPTALRRRLTVSGLGLPRLTLTRPSRYLAWAAAAGVILAPLALSVFKLPLAGVSSAAMIALIAVINWLDPHLWPEDCHTLGELARLTAPLNIPALRANGAAVRPTDAWALVVSTIEEITGFPRASIRPDTSLYR